MRKDSTNDAVAWGAVGAILGVSAALAVGGLGLWLYNVVLFEAVMLGLAAGLYAMIMWRFSWQLCFYIGVGVAVLFYLLFRTKVGFWLLVSILVLADTALFIWGIVAVVTIGDFTLIEAVAQIFGRLVCWIMAVGVTLIMHLTARERWKMRKAEQRQRAYGSR